jgi:hypothetical protein
MSPGLTINTKKMNQFEINEAMKALMLAINPTGKKVSDNIIKIKTT